MVFNFFKDLKILISLFNIFPLIQYVFFKRAIFHYESYIYFPIAPDVNEITKNERYV